MPYRSPSRFLRDLALPLLLGALAPLAASAAERATLTPPWRAGETLVYDTESVFREGAGRERSVRRVTDRSELRTEAVGRDGTLLTWTTRNSRVETVEGDRVIADIIATMTDAYDGYVAGMALDRDGRYRGLHDIAGVTAKLREVMAPAFEQNLQRLIGPIDPKLSKYDREDALAQMRVRVQEVLDQTLAPASVEAMMSSQIRPLTAFAGKTLTAGRTYRDREPLRAELDGRAVPARREYTLSIDREDPNLARIRWTHTLDPKGDAEALWALADAYGGGGDDEDARRGRPRDLQMREEGSLLFRRDNGVVVLLEVVTASRYGDRHDEERRMRMRLYGTARTWAQEEAARGP
jgi:hypothetical protein